MTKKLQELFSLPDDVHITQEEVITTDPVPSMESLTTLEKIDSALTQVRGLEASDTELDSLAELSINSYKDLMELGMQVDSRFSAEIFNSASSFLGHAITSKTAKIQKKLKMLDLQLKKHSLDLKAVEKSEELDAIPVGTGQNLDRNELLKIHASKSLPQ